MLQREAQCRRNHKHCGPQPQLCLILTNECEKPTNRETMYFCISGCPQENKPQVCIYQTYPCLIFEVSVGLLPNLILLIMVNSLIPIPSLRSSVVRKR